MRPIGWLSLVALVALGLQAPAGADGLETRSSPNLELVAQIPGAGGTDLEFFSRTLESYRDADGTVITPDQPVERHFAFVGNQTSGPKIVDITNPEEPFVAAAIPSCTVGQGDIQVNAEGTIAAIARQTSGSCTLADGRRVSNGSIIVDLSDVYAPTPVGHARESAGSHNNTLHPSGQYLYISTSALAPNTNTTGARVPIYDISDPEFPRLVQNWVVDGNGPHDIRFSHDGTRAYLAGISTYRIVNTEDPENPELISTIVPPGGTIGHDTLVTPDKAFLFLGDEGGGGGTYPCPGGAIYVYDIRIEENPILLGAAEAGGGPVVARQWDEVPGPTTLGGCTSHVMELNPDERSLTLGWYRLGTRVFDFSMLYDDEGNPRPLPSLAWGPNGAGLVETGYMIPEGANTWSAKQYEKVPGYIFSDDLLLGFYVTKILES